ncbi:MAG: DsbE family thiol:disulfide interchange protein [Methylococcaceae bacterium]
MVNVWASWCVSCRQEHATLVELSRQAIVPIYGLNYKDEREAALRWLKVLGNPYNASAFDADGRIGIEWGVYGVPETFVIDRKGTIRYKHTGPVTPEALEKTLLPLIRQLQAQPA